MAKEAQWGIEANLVFVRGRKIKYLDIQDGEIYCCT